MSGRTAIRKGRVRGGNVWHASRKVCDSSYQAEPQLARREGSRVNGYAISCAAKSLPSVATIPA